MEEQCILTKYIVTTEIGIRGVISTLPPLHKTKVYIDWLSIEDKEQYSYSPQQNCDNPSRSIITMS
jgi:hypothetical protein